MSKWKKVRLGDIASYNDERIEMSSLNQNNYVSTENMLPNKDGITKATSLPSTKYAIKYNIGQTLVSNIRPYFKKIWFANKNGGCSNDVLCFKLNNTIDKHFFYYLLSQDCFFNYVMNGAKGTKMPRGDKNHILDYEVFLPPLQEQRRIAAILSCLDYKIELNNRINVNLEAQAQAIFKEWFIDGRKKEWGKIELKDVVNTTSGGTPSRKDFTFYDNGTIKWVKSKELTGKYIIDTEEKITEESIKKSSVKILPANSILIAMYGATVGEYAIISEQMACNQAICALLPNTDYPATFLFMFIKNKKEELKNYAIGSAQQNISQEIIKQLKVPTCINTIKKYDNIVLPFFKMAKYNTMENKILANLRNNLLPKLINKSNL